MESELSRVVDALPGLVWTTRPDGGCDFINQRWCEFTGLGVGEALDDGWLAAIHPEDLPALAQRWRAILASGAAGETEARIRRADGAYRRFHIGACPIAGPSGEVVKWCGINTDIEDRRRAEDALRLRETHYRTVADSIPALIAFMTPAGELENVNRHILDYFGTTLEDLRDWPSGDTVHPDDRPAVIAAWRRSVDTGEPYDVEQRMRRADGVYRWFRVHGLPLRDADGRVARWYVLETDIDDRKRTEALLAGEKQMLEMVAAGRPMPQILEALCRLVESTAGGCYCSVVLVDRGRARLEHGAAPSLPASFIAAIKGRPVNVESGPSAMAACLNQQVIAADIASEGRWVASGWCAMALAHGLRSCWSSPIASAAGQALGAFAIYYDEPKAPTPQHQALIDQFTSIASIAVERAQNLEELKRSEARKAAMLDSVLDCIVTIDHQGRIIEFNPAAERTFGYPRAEVVGRPLAEVIIPPAQREAHRQGLARYLATSEARVIGRRVEMTAMRADGGEFPVELAITRIPSDGAPSFTGYLRDLTERKQSEEALGKVRSELAHMARVTSLGALTASIAHEVNQPLSGIITNASTCLRMLAAEPPNVEGALETARRTIRDGNRAADVITRLRALFGKQDAMTEPVDLNEATREVVALSWSELQRNRVALSTELADGLPPVAGDRVQLQQVILNLVLNASEAMNGLDDRPRRLVISTEPDDDERVRLSVRDAGVGLDPEGLKRLFEAFYTTKSGGMGIGLSVSRSIIESHQGLLWATPNEGPGATFSFSIPRAAEPAMGALGARTISAATPAERAAGAP